MGKTLCICCLVILLIIPIVIFSPSLVTQSPRLYIQDLYVPALNTFTQSNFTKLNTFIFIDLKVQNVMPLNGLRYGDVNLNFYYGSNRSLSIAKYTVPGFYHGLKTAHKRVVVRTRGIPWDVAFGEVYGGSTVLFGVDLTTTVKLKRCGVYTKRKEMVVGGDVRVDRSGEEVRGNTVRLE